MSHAASLPLPLLLLLLSLRGSLTFPDGAPEYACGDMLPGHPGAQQFNASDSPYRLTQDKAQFTPNDSVTVTLYAKNSHFKGFLVKALDENDTEVGHFSRGALYQPLQSCSAATHVNKKKKTNVKLLWVAPANASGRVHFKATVVYKYSRFYTDLMSTVRSRRQHSRRLSVAFNKL
ncbi:putative defense protein [Haemaphysalis longicornis]|uniref:Reelin domain-containing protein n=1 Tax=Haemaphysalis longicornis TaxID=44386 RepID=A0A9J6G2E9_HAELO|nr:hypothetical protein HPB48_004675 [Haemaphysalis longicornis]